MCDSPNSQNGNNGHMPMNLNQKRQTIVWNIAFVVFGIALLSPWNLWIQQTEYYRLRLKGSVFAGSFESWISVVFQIGNISTLIYLLQFPNKINLEKRIFFGLYSSIAIFLLAAVLPTYDSLGPNLYFFIILFLVGLSSAVSGLLAAMIGFCSRYPSDAMTSINAGQGIAGLMPSIAQLLLKSDKTSVSIYFLLGVLFSGLALFANYILGRPEFAPTRIQGLNDMDEESEEGDSENGDRSRVFSEIKFASLTVFITLFITLSVFPAITATVQSLEDNEKFVLYHFLIYSAADFLGKSSTVFVRLSIDKVVVLAFLRFLFIPIILACNVVLYDQFGNSRGSIFPLLFRDEVFYFIIFGFGFSNGFLTTSAFICCPSLIKSPNTETLAFAGDLMQLFLTLGLTFGSLFTFILQAISCRCNPFS